MLKGVTIHEQPGRVGYVILRCTSLMGLLRTRRLLRQDQLIVDAERGGFALTDRAMHARESACITSTPCRLDPNSGV
jgi:hypothetical protein